jgi:hypothetical protein
MFFRDMTISNPIKIPQGSVIVLTLTATGLDPFFIGNLTKQLTNESYSGLAYQLLKKVVLLILQ